MADSLKALKTYTNADVARVLKPTLSVRRDTGTPERPLYAPDWQEMVSPDAILRGAHGALDRANAMGDQSALLALPASLNALRAHQEAARPYSGQELLRGGTEAASELGGVVGLGSMIPGPQQPFMAATSSALMAPNALRHMLLPADDETRLGGIAEAGMAALPFAPKGIKKGLGAFEDWQAERRMMRSLPPGLGMNYVESAAAPVAHEAAHAVSDVRLSNNPEDIMPSKARMNPDAQAAQLKKDTAYDRARGQDPAMQARRRAAIEALMNLDAFKGVR